MLTTSEMSIELNEALDFFSNFNNKLAIKTGVDALSKLPKRCARELVQALLNPKASSSEDLIKLNNLAKFLVECSKPGTRKRNYQLTPEQVSIVENLGKGLSPSWFADQGSSLPDITGWHKKKPRSTSNNIYATLSAPSALYMSVVTHQQTIDKLKQELADTKQQWVDAKVSILMDNTNSEYLILKNPEHQEYNRTLQLQNSNLQELINASRNAERTANQIKINVLAQEINQLKTDLEAERRRFSVVTDNTCPNHTALVGNDDTAYNTALNNLDPALKALIDTIVKARLAALQIKLQTELQRFEVMTDNTHADHVALMDPNNPRHAAVLNRQDPNLIALVTATNAPLIALQQQVTQLQTQLNAATQQIATLQAQLAAVPAPVAHPAPVLVQFQPPSKPNLDQLLGKGPQCRKY